MGNTLIDWTDKVWNPCTGCEKIAAECRECYAEKMARRLQAMGNPRYVNGFKMTLHPEALKEPFEWKGNGKRRRRRIFNNNNRRRNLPRNRRSRNVRDQEDQRAREVRT